MVGTGASSSSLPVGELAARYRSDLFDDFLPFMDEHVIDHEHGGFMCTAGPDGRRDSDTKSSWFEGRGHVRESYRRSGNGSSFWMHASDRRVSLEGFAALPRRTEHYHHLRHLMLNLLACERSSPNARSP